MPNLSGRPAQSQTDAMHNLAVLHARFEPEYSMIIKFGCNLKLMIWKMVFGK